MSRIANSPVALPSSVEVKLSGQDISVKGAKGEMGFAIHDLVELVQEESELKVRAKSEERGAKAMAGTMRAIVQNMVTGVTEGFAKRLELQGVGYRAQAQGKINAATRVPPGGIHPPEGITAETPSQTEIVISGVDKQRVGQVCAEIRIPSAKPYKGKGVRYADNMCAQGS